ncbi:sugar ABC transporter permease, partial [Bifidobacterium sp. WCA-178-WT-4B]|nr:sugar ABC transporter permease [Bifidobacterium sp. WCA-178-WT-4B]MSR96865.1 sugar ABC transporter permease [Bifidobacterium sp. WCA-178-WT-4B]
MDETAMATMLLAGSFRRVRRKTMTNATAQPDTSVMRKPKR